MDFFGVGSWYHLITKFLYPPAKKNIGTNTDRTSDPSQNVKMDEMSEKDYLNDSYYAYNSAVYQNHTSTGVWQKFLDRLTRIFSSVSIKRIEVNWLF
jgi:hypothetical protein